MSASLPKEKLASLAGFHANQFQCISLKNQGSNNIWTADSPAGGKGSAQHPL
jgi:hypothetical protein